MKNVSLWALAILLGLTISCNTNGKAKDTGKETTEKTVAVAEEQVPDSGVFFVGKWKIIPSGLPGGDQPLIVSLERKDGKLTGTLTKEGSTEIITFYSVTEKPESIVLNFKSGEHDVNMSLYKKDDNNITGSIMGMFNLTGSRIAK